MQNNNLNQLDVEKNASVAQPVGKKKIEILSFLRAIAALSVCLYHYTGAVLPKLRIESVREIFQDGWLGVDVFFVISGFIIPYSLMGKDYKVNGFFSYMKKRIVRINPPAYISMGLVLLQGFVIDYFISHKVVYTANVSWGQIINNIFFTVPFSKYTWVVGIFWTLAIEFQFYIFIGLLFNVLFTRFNIYIFSGIFLILGPVQYLPFQSNEHLFRFSSLFALGGSALLYYNKNISIKQYALLLILFFITACIELNLYMASAGLVTVIFISFINIKNRVFDFLGNISYSFYLLHALIGSTCEYFLIRFIDPNPVFNKLVMLVICIVAAIIGSYIFYVLIERRFMLMANGVYFKKSYKK